MPKHDICIVGLKCYDLLTGSSVPRFLGGIEKLLVSLARGLSRAGVNTAFITYDHGQSDGEIVDGVTVYKSFSTDSGLPGIRFIHPRMTKLWSAMQRADAAVYLQMGAGSETGRVALGSRYFLDGKKSFAFLLASDKDGDKNAIDKFPLRERLLYLYGLKAADLLVAQTMKQKAALHEGLGLESTVLPMPIESPDGVDILEKAQHWPSRHHVLWIGRIIETKRLEFLFEVAEKCPGVTFDVVGTPNRHSEYFENLTQAAVKVKNVILHGRVAEGVLPKLYRESTILSCTSTLEGFPTTFLESWSYGIPVVTTFDPDDVIATYGLGEVVRTVDEMVAAINRLTASPENWLPQGKRALEFFQKNYTLEAILPEFQRHFLALGA